jgi:four helix bundle protein
MSEFRTFRDLECWRACRDLRVFVAKQILPALPRDEKYRLGDQMIRAARSTTANIAEGYGRYHYLDNAKFCCNARGSAYETLDHLITAHDEGMMSDEFFRKGEGLVEQAVKLLNGYVAYLQRAGGVGKVREDAAVYEAGGTEIRDSLVEGTDIGD